MKIEWLNKKGQNELIIFFNGWGMDINAVKHLEGDFDVLMFYDYRTLQLLDELPDLTGYDKKYVIAWSMGVWAASNICYSWNDVDMFVAINGTERPVCDSYGIPCNIYSMTEKGMNERGREKFFFRMLKNREEVALFGPHKPVRLLEEQLEELTHIREESETHRQTVNWSRAFISDYDIIFPVQNQHNWWDSRTQVISVDSGHYPFYNLKNWNDILCK
ncbi:DUF452 family protein [Odoribacter sp. OttesenSCG-928-J03]|nr:DUF452 family protein [Odoribacter sp. OttesenSCG-928-J03]